MNKFKVGDKVVGNKDANQYSITVEGWTGVVIKLGEADRNSIYVRPLDNPDHEGFEVLESCFDLKPANLTKEETLDLLSTQHDCFYSLPQVVEMIKNIKDPEPIVTDKVSVLEEDFEDILDQVFDAVEGDISDSSRSAYIDLDSADFYLESNNRLILEDVDIDGDAIAEMVREKVEEVLSKYVTIIEKSETLRS